MEQATELEQLIRELNDPRNQSLPETIDSIQRQIQRLQRMTSAWQWGMDLLSHNEAVMRFYGALTLTIKINADWDIDKVGEDRDLVNHLLENLVSSYVRLASIPDASFVLQKLCTTLVAFFQKPQSAWALPIRHLTACMVANRYLAQDTVPELARSFRSNKTISGAQLKYLLMFPTTLAEQDSVISGSTREQNVRVRINNNSTDVLNLLHFAATSFGEVGKADNMANIPAYTLLVDYNEAQFFDMAKMMLQLIPLWTSDIKTNSNKPGDTRITKFDYFQSTVGVLPRLFLQRILAPTVLQTLTSLEDSTHRLLQTALPHYEKEIINSQQAKSWVAQLVSGDFDPDAIIYLNFLEACMSQVDVTSPDYLSVGSYIELLKQVRMLLQCDGAAGVDDTVCQVALEVLTSVTEGYSDWDGPSSFDDSMKGLITDACSSALDKIRIPQEELSTRTQTWDAGDRAKFQDFRYDVQDYLQNAFSILGESLIEEIVRAIIGSGTTAGWDLFEAGLFSLVAFSDTLANEPDKFDQYLIAALSCEKWRVTINAEVEVPDRVRQMMIKVMGEATGFLQRHTNFLIPSLNFLFTSLHMSSSATAASKAISTLCDAQRSMLAEALPQFMVSLDNISDVELDAKHRIYAAVGALIQALPSEDAKVQPLTHILHHLIEQEIDSQSDSISTYDEVVSKAIDILQTVSYLGRGLRAPLDTPVDLDKNESNEDRFWIDGRGSVVQQQLFHIHGKLIQRTSGQDSPSFIEASCGFLRSGFTEDHPSPYKFSNSRALEILSVYMRSDCPQPDHVMSTASSYLASVDPEDATNEFYTLWMMSIRALNEAYINNRDHGQPLNSDLCTSTLDFCVRLLPRWAPSLFQLPEAQGSIGLVIEIGLVLIQDSDTLPRRNAASFFTAIFESSGQPSLASNDEASSSMSATLQNFTPRIIAAILHLLAGVCARSDIDALAETIKKAVQKQPLLTNRLLKEALKDENAVLTPKALQATKPEQRARFASQVEMLRGARKTNEIVRDFWIACRGREFEYVT